jgi:hypothetical protein
MRQRLERGERELGVGLDEEEGGGARAPFI